MTRKEIRVYTSLAGIAAGSAGLFIEPLMSGLLIAFCLVWLALEYWLITNPGRELGQMSDGKDDQLKVGNRSVVYGNVKGSVGDQSVVAGPTHGTNTILTNPMAIGYEAYAGPGSIAMGYRAGAGDRPKTDKD